jgi:HlyD family secretion protein
VITAGTPLIELSNPSRLGVVIDLLSTDAVSVNNGARVIIDGWGGQENLEARVRLVEPSAFTKISALGIEEQRVNVIADFVGSTGPLADAFRVEAHIVTWESGDVLMAPPSALFRTGEKWGVFVVEAGKAHRREVGVGSRTSFAVEIMSGIEDGTEVIVHPPNELSDGARIEARRDS